MITDHANRREIMALVAVTGIILALVGFLVVQDDEQDLEIDTGAGIAVADQEEVKTPTPAEERADQLRREAQGLPTGKSRKLDGRSHLHGGYGTTFRVVEKATGTGVSGAVVYFMPRKAANEIDWLWRRVETIRQRGLRLKADHWGDVRIKNFIGSALVICEHKGLYGELAIKSFHDVLTTRHELLLEPDPAVRIQVINADGKGVPGVPVALWRDNSKAHEESGGQAPRRILIWTGKTWGRQGLAMARRSLGARSSPLAQDEGWNGPLSTHLAQGGVYATFYFPPLVPDSLFEETQKAVAEESLNDASGVTRALLEQVREVRSTSLGPQCDPLELPATGSIKLVMRRDDGSLYDEPCTVWLGAFRGERGRGPGAGRRSMDFDPKLQSASDGSLPFVAEKGVVTLPFVGIDSAFNITVMPMNQSHDAVAMLIHGPSRHRETRVIDIPLGPERAEITARVRDGEGNWYTQKPLQVSLAVPGVNIFGLATKHRKLKTDAEGFFSIRVPVEFSRYPKMEIRILSTSRRPGLQPPFAAQLMTPPAPGDKRDDLILSLKTRGLICRGRVLDEKNRPLANASIVITRDPFGENRQRQGGDDRLYALTQPSEEPEIVAEITSNRQGYFTYGGYVQVGTWQLYIHHQDDATERELTLPFEPGTSNMQLKLHPVPPR